MAIHEVTMYQTTDGHRFETKQQAYEYEFVQDLIMVIVGDDDVAEDIAEGVADRIVEYYHLVRKDPAKDTRLE